MQKAMLNLAISTGVALLYLLSSAFLFSPDFFTANTTFSNGGALGVGNNPGGETPVFSITHACVAPAAPPLTPC